MWQMKSLFTECNIFLRDSTSSLSSSSKQQQLLSSDSLTSWQSSHLRDCKEVVAATTITAAASKSTTLTLDKKDLVVQIKMNTILDDIPSSSSSSFLMSIHDPAKDGVSRFIYENGCWECHHLRDMLGALRAYGPNSYLLDVGGNIGMWTLAAAAANHQTFTMEPSRENYEQICKTVNKNQFHNRIHLMTIAATSVPATTFTLNIPRNNKGGTSVVVAATATGTNKTDLDSDSDTKITTTIQGFSIDSLNLPLDRPVVMKIDVEGHELEALTDALEF